MENSLNYTQSFTNSTQIYDLSVLEEMDDNEYVFELITILLLETPKALKAMKDGVRAGKADIICRNAHNLKSSAGIIQAFQFSALLEDIENKGKASGMNNELAALVENAAQQYNCIERELKIHIKEFVN